MTQGVLYGIGSGFLFAPCVSFIDEWFLVRRGFANGLLYYSLTTDAKMVDADALSTALALTTSLPPHSPLFSLYCSNVSGLELH